MSTTASIGSLESQSLWYHYKTLVWLDTASPESAAIHNIMRVLRSIRNSGDLAYVSVPITSGVYYYDCLLRDGAVDIEAVIAHNYDHGWKFVKEVQARRECPVLYPSDLVPAKQKWGQDHFQALWLSIIGEKVTEVHMSPGWEYSNGGAEEFTHVMQLRLGLPRHTHLAFYNTKENEAHERERMKSIAVYDAFGYPISLEMGIEAIQEALGFLRTHDLKTERLENCVRLLESTRHMLAAGFYQ